LLLMDGMVVFNPLLVMDWKIGVVKET
jgi:hypothetical protein